MNLILIAYVAIKTYKKQMLKFIRICAFSTIYSFRHKVRYLLASVVSVSPYPLNDFIRSLIIVYFIQSRKVLISFLTSLYLICDQYYNSHEYNAYVYSFFQIYFHLFILYLNLFTWSPRQLYRSVQIFQIILSYIFYHLIIVFQDIFILYFQTFHIFLADHWTSAVLYPACYNIR